MKGSSSLAELTYYLELKPFTSLLSCLYETVRQMLSRFESYGLDEYSEYEYTTLLYTAEPQRNCGYPLMPLARLHLNGH